MKTTNTKQPKTPEFHVPECKATSDILRLALGSILFIATAIAIYGGLTGYLSTDHEVVFYPCTVCAAELCFFGLVLSYVEQSRRKRLTELFYQLIESGQTRLKKLISENPWLLKTAKKTTANFLTPLYYGSVAQKTRHQADLSLVTLLLDKARPEKTTQLEKAIALSATETVHLLLKNGSDVGEELLKTLTKETPVDIVELLVAKYLQKRMPNLPLDAKKDRLLVDAMELKDELAIKLLRMKGARPNAQDQGGNTPLHYAVKASDVQKVRDLMALGANPLIRNNHGWDAIYIATCIESKKRLEIQMLLRGDIQ